MKVVFLSRILFLSGVTTHIRDLAKELVRQGHSVTILTSGQQFTGHTGMDSLVDSMREIPGLRIIHIGYPRAGRFSYLKLIPSFFATWKVFRREKFDVIHVHTAVLSFIPKLLGYKFVTTIHVAKLKLSIFQSKPTHQIAISREVYQESIDNGINPDNLSLVFNGVDKKYAKTISAEEKEALKQSYSLPADKLLIGFVGTLCYRKGIDLLVNAVALLDKPLADKVHIVLVGNFDSTHEKSWFDNVLQQSGISSKVTILPFQSPENLYKIFDIFVLPSRLEGFGLVSVEAMLSGCCCIRSNSEGAFDQIEDRKTGFLFENGNTQQLADILQDLIENPQKRIAIANAGKEKSLEEFTSEVMTRKTVEVYKKVINEY